MKYSKEWLENEVSQGNKVEFFGFWGNKMESEMQKSMSNFYKVDIRVNLYNGVDTIFQNSEQVFMYNKAVLFNDLDTAQKIAKQGLRPEQYKQLGREVKGFDEQVWLKHREKAMYDAVYAKFSQNRRLKDYLLGTRNKVLVEASPFDKIWGIGLGTHLRNGQLDKTFAWKDVSKWKGDNLLGFSLMEVREALR